jgi:hypothetical protein
MMTLPAGDDTRGHRAAWVAPLLVGASAAIAAEVATGILLYAGPGLMRSLTTVLAVEGAALAAGLWSAPAAAGRPLIDRLRRRWLFCLLAFMAAALFGTSWSVVQDLGGGPVGQGVGLAVLAALPLYACGLVLAGMAAVAASDTTGRLRSPGAAAALGAALGFVLTGALLPRAPIPASLLVACLVLLSAGGMIYGAVLSSRPVVQLRAARESMGGDVRVEDRLRVADVDAARYLLENGHVRRWQRLEGNGSIPWDVEVVRSLLGEGGAPKRVLALGGGASPLPRYLEGRPDIAVDVLERNPAVVDLARAHFDTEPGGESADRSSIRMGNLEDLLAEVRGPYDLVLVDTAALAPLGGARGLSRSARSALLGLVASGGCLVAGPLPADSDLTGAAVGWSAAELRRGSGRPAAPSAGAEEVLVVSRPAGAQPWSAAIGTFEPRNGEPPEA